MSGAPGELPSIRQMLRGGIANLGATTPTEKIILLHLIDRADQDGIAWPEQRTIATDLGLARSTVQASITRLHKTGLIAVAEQGRQHLSTRYAVLPEARGSVTWNGSQRPGDRSPGDDPRGPGIGHLEGIQRPGLVASENTSEARGSVQKYLTLTEPGLPDLGKALRAANEDEEMATKKDRSGSAGLPDDAPLAKRPNLDRSREPRQITGLRTEADHSTRVAPAWPGAQELVDTRTGEIASWPTAIPGSPGEWEDPTAPGSILQRHRKETAA